MVQVCPEPAIRRGFKADCPDGLLGKDKIIQMYSMILPDGNATVSHADSSNFSSYLFKVFVDQIFRIFDKDENGSIDFKVQDIKKNIFIYQEFMMATDMTGSGTPEEKLRWAFHMYDKDNSGDLLHNEQIKSKVYRFY